MQSLNLLASIRQPAVQHSVVESYRALSSTSEPLLAACGQAFEALLDSIQQNNSRRWFGRLSPEQFQQMRERHQAALDHLKEEVSRYPKSANKALLDAHDYLFDDAGHLRDGGSSSPKIAGLFVGFNVEDRLVRFAESLQRPLEHVILLEGERTTRRLWSPAGLRKLFSWVFGASSSPVLNLPTSETFPEVDKEALKEMHDKLKGRSRPVKKRNKFSAIVLGFAHWLSNEEGIFALRVLIATISVAVIAVTTQTAGFFYREKVLLSQVLPRRTTANVE